MHSYIAIHQFTPIPKYKSIEALLPFIEETIRNQNVKMVLSEDEVTLFRENIVECMKVYYKLVGITDEVIESGGIIEPRGVLPRYTEGLIRYFQDLQWHDSNNKEMKILEYSGVTTIKIRYKYTDSVIKKLVKLGLKDPDIFDEPLKIFLKGGVLHDLLGMLFIYASPYEKIWVARAMYNFFEYDYRTDDHLVYGFYTVERESGYKGLHCDYTLFDPRYDIDFSSSHKTHLPKSEEIFSLLDDEDDSITVVNKLKPYFNIELQLHSTFENLWASMEHRNSYNVQAKGLGRKGEITAQWKLLSDNMQNLEMQFERLQIDTEQANFKVADKEGYRFIQNVFETLGSEGKDIYSVYRGFQKKIESLETLFSAREISRQDYVEQIFKIVKDLDHVAQEQNDPTVYVLFKLGSAFIHFSLANHREFFNTYDLHRFVQTSLDYYKDIHRYIDLHSGVCKVNMIHIIAILRYLQLAEKYGYGLIDLKDVVYTYSTTPAVSYDDSVLMFEKGISLMNRLSKDDLSAIRHDIGAYIRIIHRFEILSQEWELFQSDVDKERGKKISAEIVLFRKKFINVSLFEEFEILLDRDKITNVGFVVRFYSLMIWHHICKPIDALKQIIKYSAYDTIKTSDIFYYELAAYRFLVVNRCEQISDCEFEEVGEVHASEIIRHYSKYHRNNMIQQLFRIYRDEPIYDFHKVRVHFEKLTGSTFNINHFSDTISQSL